MKTFRLLLTLMLCLAVPMAGWASVMSGPLCPKLQHEHATALDAPHHSHAAHGLVANPKADHHAQHCAGTPVHDKSCKGDHCGCGCGTGACSSSQLPLLAMSASNFLPLADKGGLPHSNAPAFVAVRGSSLLRPPIS